MSEDAFYDAEAVAPVSNIEAKMPKFIPDQPAIFFVIAEAQFTLRNVRSDEAKYAHVVSALPPEVIIRVADLVTTPPATDKYGTIKRRLTKSFEKTPAERATKLLETEDLGGRTPLALLDEMRNLSRGEDLDFLLRAIFLRALPEEVRRVVRNSTQPLEELAAAAEDHFTKAGAAARNCIAPCKMAPPSNPAGQRRPGNADAGGKYPPAQLRSAKVDSGYTTATAPSGF